VKPVCTELQPRPMPRHLGNLPRFAFQPEASMAFVMVSSRPQLNTFDPVGVTSPTRVALERRAAALATATGLTVLHEYPVEVYQRFGLDRSLAGAAMNRARIPAVTLELGARRVVDPVAVDTAVTATLGVLHALGLGFEPAPTHPTILVDGPWRRGSGPRVGRDGWLTPEVAPGVRVKAKQRIAVVRDLVGEILEIVTAVDDGVVVSWVDGGWVSIGQAVGTFAVQERR